MKCSVCKKNRVVSLWLGKCEACIYAEEKGEEAARRQIVDKPVRVRKPGKRSW